MTVLHVTLILTCCLPTSPTALGRIDAYIKVKQGKMVNLKKLNTAYFVPTKYLAGHIGLSKSDLSGGQNISSKKLTKRYDKLVSFCQCIYTQCI